MALIKIEIEDNPTTGNVKVTADPPWETLAKKIDSGHDMEMTGAETYALIILRKIRELSRGIDRERAKLVEPIGPDNL